MKQKVATVFQIPGNTVDGECFRSKNKVAILLRKQETIK